MGITYGRRALAAAALVLTLAAAACGGDDGGAKVATAGGNAAGADRAQPTASVDPEAARLAFARCMRENGVDMPDPGAGGPMVLQPEGGSQETFRRAQEACREHLEALPPGGPGGEDRSEMQDKFLKFAQCMRENGVDMPDPKMNGGRVMVGGPGIDPNDPTFQAAQKLCQERFGLPQPQGGH